MKTIIFFIALLNKRITDGLYGLIVVSAVTTFISSFLIGFCNMFPFNKAYVIQSLLWFLISIAVLVLLRKKVKIF